MMHEKEECEMKYLLTALWIRKQKENHLQSAKNKFTVLKNIIRILLICFEKK